MIFSLHLHPVRRARPRHFGSISGAAERPKCDTLVAFFRPRFRPVFAPPRPARRDGKQPPRGSPGHPVLPSKCPPIPTPHGGVSEGAERDLEGGFSHPSGDENRPSAGLKIGGLKGRFCPLGESKRGGIPKSTAWRRGRKRGEKCTMFSKTYLFVAL